MLEKWETDIGNISSEIDSMQEFDTTIKKRKAEMKQGLDLIDTIFEEKAISNANLRLLVEEITVYENGGKLQITVQLHGNFRRHLDIYNSKGELTDSFFECDFHSSDEE